jgi:hypothetical protein
MRRLSPSLSAHQHSALTPRLATERMRIVYPVRGIVQAARHFPCIRNDRRSLCRRSRCFRDEHRGRAHRRRVRPGGPLDAPSARDYCRPCGTSERSSRNYLGVLNLAPPYSLCCGSLLGSGAACAAEFGTHAPAQVGGLHEHAFHVRRRDGVSARRRHGDSSGPGTADR